MASKQVKIDLPKHVTSYSKGGTTYFKFQRRVPLDVQPLVHRKSWEISLGSDATQLDTRTTAAKLETDQIIDTARRVSAGDLAVPAAVASVGQHVEQRVEEAVEEGTAKLPGWEGAMGYMRTARALPEAQERIALAFYAAKVFGAPEWLEEAKKEYPDVMRAVTAQGIGGYVMSRMFEALDKLPPSQPPTDEFDLMEYEGKKGHVIARLTALTAKSVDDQTKTLKAYSERYIKARALSAQGARGQRKAVRRFTEFLTGDPDANGPELGKITAQQMRDWSDFMAEETDENDNRKVSNRTINTYVGQIGFIMKWAYQREEISENARLRVPSLKDNSMMEDTRWKAFNDEDMKTVWAAVNDAWGPGGSARLSEERKAAFLWTFKVLLYTGMRPNEVFLLEPRLVRPDTIHPEKTKTGRKRNMPLASHIAGFHDFIRSDTWTAALQKERGRGIKTDLHETMSQNFTTIIRGAGLTDTRHVLYSTKDTLVNRLQRARRRDEIIRGFTGHVGKVDSLDHYKTAIGDIDEGMAEMREAIEAVRYW